MMVYGFLVDSGTKSRPPINLLIFPLSAVFCAIPYKPRLRERVRCISIM
jgi:hypothetical protein